MKFVPVSLLSLTYCCLVSALPPSPSSLADSRLLLSAKAKPDVAAAAAAVPAKPQQCVYADVSKTGRKTIVCGDAAPPTLASLLQSAKPAAAAAVEVIDDSLPLQQVQARTFLEKCFGDKKKKEQVAVYVQQPEYHQQEYYHPPVQYVQQPQVQYLQPQIQYVQPQVQLVQPQVHVQAPAPQVHYVQSPPQVHYVQAPPQVHYIKEHQQHYVQAPLVHYVQPYQHPIKTLCPQDSYYGRSAGGYPVQMMRAVDAGQTVLMAVDDDDDGDSDDDNDGVDDDSPVAAARSSSSDPTLAVVWSGEQPVVSARGAIDGGTAGRPVPAFGSVFRPTAYRAASEGVRFREYPGDIAADFQQQLSQQQQQVHDLSGSLPQQYGDYQPQQQVSYGFPGQMQSSPSSSFGSPYGSMRRSSGGPVEFRAALPVGYPVRPATKEFLPGQGASMRSNVEDARRPDAVKSSSQQQQQLPQQQQSSVVAAPNEVPVENNAASKTAAAGVGLKNSGAYD